MIHIIIQNLPVLIVIIPLITAFLMPIIGLFKIRYCFYTSLISISITLLIGILILNSVINDGTIHYHIGNWEPPYGIEYVIDYLNTFMILLITSVAFIITIYSRRSVEKELPNNIALFYTLFVLFITGLLGIVVTGDLFNLYVFLEITSLAAYTLISLGEKRDALIASFNYLIMGSIAACFILIGIGFIYTMTGSLNMADVSIRLKDLYDSNVVHAAVIFFIVGLSIKIALFPLHTWLPNAYTHAPSTVSALIASLMSKVCIYIMIRILFSIFTVQFFLHTVPVGEILSWIAAIAIILGSINAIAQTDIKRMLAYSSVSQIGYIVLGMGLANYDGLTGSLLHILNHAFMKGCLFLTVGAIIYKTGIRNIYDFKGLLWKMPVTMLAFTIASLSMVGIPPLCGFFSKWYLALGSIKSGKWIFALVILLSSLLNAAYFFRILERALFGKYEHKTDEAPKSMLIPITIMAIGCIVFGIFGQFMEIISKSLI